VSDMNSRGKGGRQEKRHNINAAMSCKEEEEIRRYCFPTQFVSAHTHSSIVGLVHQRLNVHGPLPQLLLGPIVIALCTYICVGASQ